MEHLFNISG